MGTYNIKKEERLKSLFSRPLFTPVPRLFLVRYFGED